MSVRQRQQSLILMISLYPKSIENRAALRCALATLTAIMIAYALHLDKPYWSGMTVVILANLYTGPIIDKAIMRIVGTLIGAWVGFFIAHYVANSLLLYLLINFLIISFAVYYYNFSHYAYAWLLGALGAFIVIAQIAINPEEVFYVAIWRPIEIGLGVLVSAAFAYCIFPNTITANLEQEIKTLFINLGELIDLVTINLNDAEPDLNPLKEDNLNFRKKLRKASEMTGFMRLELGVGRERIDQFRLVLGEFYRMSRELNYLLLSFEFRADEKTRLVPVLTPVFNAIQNDLNALSLDFFGRIDADFPLQSLTAMASVNKSDFTKSPEASRLIDFLTLFVTMMQRLQQLLPRPPGKQKISHQRQLRDDPDIYIHAIKAGLAALLALVFWLVSSWPGGLNGIISSIVISIRGHLFEMKNISIYRLLGCLIGGGTALFPLAFFTLDLYSFILLLFVATWAFSYFSFKFTDYAYIGLQANIALVIALAQAGGPPADLSPPLERLGGVIIGITASFIIANLLWRTDIFSLMQRQQAKLFKGLCYNRNILLDQTKSNDSELYDLATLFWLNRGLLESLETLSLSKKKQMKLDKAKQRFEQMTLMQAMLAHLEGQKERGDPDTEKTIAELSKM